MSRSPLPALRLQPILTFGATQIPSLQPTMNLVMSPPETFGSQALPCCQFGLGHSCSSCSLCQAGSSRDCPCLVLLPFIHVSPKSLGRATGLLSSLHPVSTSRRQKPRPLSPPHLPPPRPWAELGQCTLWGKPLLGRYMVNALFSLNSTRPCQLRVVVKSLRVAGKPRA